MVMIEVYKSMVWLLNRRVKWVVDGCDDDALPLAAALESTQVGPALVRLSVAATNPRMAVPAEFQTT